MKRYRSIIKENEIDEFGLNPRDVKQLELYIFNKAGE